MGEKVGIYGSGGRPLHPANADVYKRELPTLHSNNYLMKHVNRSKKDQAVFFGGESVQQRYNQRDVLIRSGKASHKSSQVKVRSERMNSNNRMVGNA